MVTRNNKGWVWRLGRIMACWACLVLLASCGKQEKPPAPEADSAVVESEAPETPVVVESEPTRTKDISPELEWADDELPSEWDVSNWEEEQAWNEELEEEWVDDEPPLDGEFDEERIFDEEVPELEPTTPLEPEEFMDAIHAALEGDMDPVDVEDILARVPQDPALLDLLKGILDYPYAEAAIKRYAAAALVHAGTSDSIQFVLDELLSAVQSGDDDRSDWMVAALESPTTEEGVSLLFDFLLERGAYSQLGDDMQPEALSSARRALLDAADREAVGDRAVELYLDARESGDTEAVAELIDGIAHPYMLARLAVSAHEEGQPADATQFVNRLVESDEQDVVHAVVQLAGGEAMPVEDAAGLLYEWSRAHPEDAMPGLFMEYLSDSTLPAEQRGLAAYGLVGTTDPEEAILALEKILGYEENPALIADIEAALTLLAEDQIPVE